MENQDETQENIIQEKERKIDYLIGLDEQTKEPGFYSQDIYLEIFKEISEVADYYKQKMLDSVFDEDHEKYAAAEEIFNGKVKKFIQAKKAEYEAEGAHDALQQFELLSAIYYLYSNKPGESKKIIIEYVEKLSATKADSQINYLQCVENRKILKQLLGFVSEKRLFDAQQKEKIKNAIKAITAAEKSFINKQVNLLTRHDQVSREKIEEASETLELIPRDQSDLKENLKVAIKQGSTLNWFKENFLNAKNRDAMLDRYRRAAASRTNRAMVAIQSSAREKDIKSLQNRIKEIMENNKLNVDQRVAEVRRVIGSVLIEVKAKESKVGSVGMGNFRLMLEALQEDINKNLQSDQEINKNLQPGANLSEKLSASTSELKKDTATEDGSGSPRQNFLVRGKHQKRKAAEPATTKRNKRLSQSE